MHDILGMLPGGVPSFVKQYAHLYEAAGDALRNYRNEVRSGTFPMRSEEKPAVEHGRERK